MAKCDLSIELDDPQAVYPGGGTITGIVRVLADKNVTTKGLIVSSGWSTHGRGNVAAGVFESKTIFTGEWRAGEKAEYRFELPVGNWPPSYHGNYLNIDHSISAQAKIAWSFDPKASQIFLMRPTGGPETANWVDPKRSDSKIGCIIFAVFMTVFVTLFCGGMIAAGGPSLVFLALGIVPLLIGIVYGFKVLLPRYLLGKVQCELNPKQVSPGDEVRGELVFQPRKDVKINAIKLTFKASEKVVSGSGSNRKTHTNVFFEKEQTLVGETTLQAGQEKRIPLAVQLPSDAPFTVELSDNELIWSTLLRIDIPRWPDWTKEIAIAVVPSGKAFEVPVSRAEEPIHVPHVERVDVPPSAITFTETANHFWELKDDRKAVLDLAEAVSGLTFDVDAFVERRLLYSGDDDPHVYKDGYAVWAHFTDPPLPMVLYVPHDLADEFEQIGRDLWKGRGTIVGWDAQHRRLQVKLESSSEI
ncbi:MAG: sporulation protein [Pirellulaceae bacterium]